jgi:iron(III) transport system permease protein
MALFVVYPIFSALQLSLGSFGAWSLSAYQQIFQTPWLLQSFWNSIRLGAGTATVAVVVAYAYALVVARTRVPGRKALNLLAILPIISPPFLFTLSVILLFGNNGLVTRQVFGIESFPIYGLWGLMFVQTLCFFPIAYLTLVGILQAIDSSLEDAALDLGANRWKCFWSVTFPLSLPGVFAAWLLVFVTSLADFANPMILGGRYSVLSVQAYLEFTGQGNLMLGAALSNLLLLPCLAAFFLQKWLLKRRSYVTVTGKPQRKDRDSFSPAARRILALLAWSLSGLTILLYMAVLAGAFTKAWGIDYRFSLEHFQKIFETDWKVIRDTVLISSLSTPIAGVLGLLTAYVIVRKRFRGRKVMEAVALLPYALPGTTVGIGYILAFNEAPFVLTGTLWIILFAFIFRHMPVGIEAAKAALSQIDPAIENAASDLGAGSAKVFFSISLPLLKPALFGGMAYVFVHCMTAVSAVIFLVSARWTHMTVLILDQVEVLRYSVAAVLCWILMAIVLFAFFLMKVALREAR